MFTTNTRARGWCDCDIAMEFARVKKKKLQKEVYFKRKMMIYAKDRKLKKNR